MRTEGRADETRRKILDAASWCFSREGYAGTTTRTVARLAKVNVATLNYHFGGKEALHTAALDAAHDELAAFAPPSDLPEDAEPRVRAVVAALYHFARSRKAALRLLLRATLNEGALPEHLRKRQATEGLTRARDLLGAMDLGREVDPLSLVSLSHLVTRYAISAERAVAPFTPGEGVDQGVARHLGDVAVALLLR